MPIEAHCRLARLETKEVKNTNASMRRLLKIFYMMGFMVCDPKEMYDYGVAGCFLGKIISAH
jgi:hypothetical protein